MTVRNKNAQKPHLNLREVHQRLQSKSAQIQTVPKIPRVGFTPYLGYFLEELCSYLTSNFAIECVLENIVWGVFHKHNIIDY